MFRQRIKKTFPPGTFLPMGQRVWAIVHLCVAFTIILWYASNPFMERHFSIKSRMAVFEAVFNASQFFELSEEEKLKLFTHYNELSKELNVSFLKKCGQSLHVLSFDINRFEKMWLVLSVLIPIYLLKKREGARQAAWLLPLVCLAFCIENYRHAFVGLTEEEKLFPTEQVIVKNYLHEPLSKSVFEQQEQLIKGWKMYLVKDWAKEEIMVGKLDEQAKKGEFRFNLARAGLIKLPNEFVPFKKLSLFMMGLYMVWNVCFAAAFWKRKEAEQVWT